jgi:hypothetical protein
MTSSSEISKRPILAYGTTPGRFGHLGKGLYAAQNAGLLALDVDLRDAWFLPSPTATALETARHIIRIRSIWLPSGVRGWFAQRRMDALGDFLRQAKQEFGLRSLILPRSQEGEDLTLINKLARDVAAVKTGTDVRLVLGLRAGDFRHDRWHLDQLTSLRRMAEEWDLDLALDLTGNVSLAWEAEAAIVRVFPRLVSVRLGQWRRDDGMLVSNQTGQIAGRTIAMLADQGYTGVISICTEPRSQEACTAIATHQKQDILQRYAPDELPAPAPQDTSISDIRRMIQ